MFVAASTDCFAHLSFTEAIQKLVDLEFACVEIILDENGNHFKPSEVAADMEKAIFTLRNSHRLDVCSYGLNITAQGEEFYRQFTACCKLAKATKVVSVTVPSAELGTPFNEEVEHLRRLVDIATLESVRVGISSQIGRLSEDPDTVKVLCDNVKGLGVTLDPSHYICGPRAGCDYAKIMKYVYHVRLRDTSDEKLQVRVGKGKVDYGRLITLLLQENYTRAMCVQIEPMEDTDHMGELRKMRLLLESLM